MSCNTTKEVIMEPAVHTSATLPTRPIFNPSKPKMSVENEVSDGNATNDNTEAAAASQSSSPRSWSPKDFLFGTTIGEGAFGIVVHGKMRPSPSQQNENKIEEDISMEDLKYNFAIKIMDKTSIIKNGLVQNVLRERTILSKLRPHTDLIVRLHASFHDAHNLYLVMDLCTGGDLAGLIRWSASSRRRNADAVTSSLTKNTFNDSIENEENDSKLCMSMIAVKYYAAQLLRVLECLHSLHIIHRDFKPENVMMTVSGRIKLVDFGAAIDMTEVKTNNTDYTTTPPLSSIPPPDDEASAASFAKASRRQRQQDESSFVGTADYVSPEIIRGAGTITPSVDLWSYGCIVYAMMVGESPFHSTNDYAAMNSIMSHANGTDTLKMDNCIKGVTGDFVSKFLISDPSSRLGAGNDLRTRTAIDNSNNEKVAVGMYHSTRAHPFFADMDWAAMERNEIEPPITPPKPKWVLEAENRELSMSEGGSMNF